LFYITGGAAFSDAEWISTRDSNVDSTKLNGVGGVIGAGAEFMVMDKVSLRGEGLYYIISEKEDISDFSSSTDGEYVEFDDAFVVRVGASIHFGGS
jgi:opacity protein-like surface antigen